MKKMAEITLNLDCGGMLKTYIKCKGEKDLLKKLRNARVDGGYGFGGVWVDDECVTYAGFKLHDIH